MIKPYKGKFKTEWHYNTTSETFTEGDLVWQESGYLSKFANADDQPPLGTIMQTIAATDDAYSTAQKCPVLIGEADAEWLCDISTGTGAQTVVGTWIDVDDHNSVDVDTGTYDIFFVTQHISTTQLVAKMSKADPRPDSIVD